MKLTRSRISLFVISIILDAVFIYLSLYLAFHLRFYSPFAELFPITKGIPHWASYKLMLYFIIPLWIFIFFQLETYRIYFLPLMDEILRLIRGITIGIFFLILTSFFYRDFSYSRAVFVLFWFFSLFFLLIYREILKLVFKYVLGSFIGKERVLVIGRDNHMVKQVLKEHPNIQAFYFPYQGETNNEDIQNIVIEKRIHQMILVHHGWPQKQLLELYDWAEAMSIELKLVPQIMQLYRGEVRIDSSLGIPVFHLKPVSLSDINFYFKRIIDLFASTFILSILSPLLLLVALLIKLSSKGPILYQHKRKGCRGKDFNFYKFRTMVTNADELLEKVKSKSERKGPVFKMHKDPRVTALGSFLRRFSIDELPQLFNVLRGDMSLVGPRPQVLWEAAAYDDWARRRLRVLPGVTGLWQISGRAELSYQEMIELDIFYIEHWSVGLDFQIIFKTIPAIFSQKGAY